MRLRTPIAWVAAAATAVGLAVVPAAIAQETVTHTSQFKVTCKTGDITLVGAQTLAPERPVNIKVTNPTEVNVGEEFEVSFSIDPVVASLASLPSIAKLERASRLKLDLARPEGTELVSYKFEGGNLDLSQAKIITVNDAGTPDPNGKVLRLTDLGNNTVNNSPSASTKSHAGLGMDLAGKSELVFDFPKVTAKLRATKAGTATVGVRTAGNATSLPNPANFLSVLASAKVGMAVWVPAWCAPLDNGQFDTRAANLASVQIKDKIAAPTTTSVTGPAEATYGDTATFSAQVSPAAAGKIEFTHGASKVTANVDAEGKASADLKLTDATGAPVTATFIPADPKSFGPSTGQTPVTVKAKATELALTAPESATPGERFEVSAQLPAGAAGTVTFTAGDQAKTVAVSAAGAAKTFFTINEAADVEVKAEFTPDNAAAYTASSATANVKVATVAVTTVKLEGIDTPAKVGEETTITATVTPAEGTTDTSGKVTFTAAG